MASHSRHPRDWKYASSSSSSRSNHARQSDSLKERDRRKRDHSRDRSWHDRHTSSKVIGKNAADKSNGLFSAEDWQCSQCSNVNWARRSTCNVCSQPKIDDEIEKRTGVGGGFNDRVAVEYKSHREKDSEDEYDDFGRKKKRKEDTSQGKVESKSSSSIIRSEKERRSHHDRRHHDKSHDRSHNDRRHLSFSEDKREDNDLEEEHDDEQCDLSIYRLDSEDEEDQVVRTSRQNKS